MQPFDSLKERLHTLHFELSDFDVIWYGLVVEFFFNALKNIGDEKAKLSSGADLNFLFILLLKSDPSSNSGSILVTEYIYLLDILKVCTS